MNAKSINLIFLICLLLIIPLSASAQCPDEPPYFDNPGFGTLGNGDAWGQASRYLCPSIDDNGNAIEPCGCPQLDPVDITYCDIPPDFCNDYWVQVDNPVTPLFPDFYQVGCDFPVGMEGGGAINIRIHGYQVRAGYEMTFGGLDPDLETVVKTLVTPRFLIAADFENKQVYGYSEWGECVWIEAPCVDGPKLATIDPMGNWVAEFSGEGNCDDDGSFQVGDQFAVQLYDDDGDSYNRHWQSDDVPLIRCEGFDVPLEGYPVKVKGKRALPLRAKLFDASSQEVTGPDVISPPVVQVWFSPNAGGDAELVTGDVLSIGHADEGNQFVYGSEGKWRFNLSTKGFSSPGTYEISMSTGDDTEYMLDRYDTCMTQFVID